MSYPKLLGKGSYGEVYKVDDSTIEKYVQMFKDLYIISENLNEAIFLASMKVPFISKLKGIRHSISKNMIIMRQAYCGIDLYKYSYKVSYAQRIQMLPNLMCQMARILLWLQRHTISHMDIKPSNLCIDENGYLNLTLIDMGFIGPVCKNGPMYHGTYEYGDPTYFSRKKQISFEYDMLGMGLSLVTFLTKDYMDKTEWAIRPKPTIERLVSRLKKDIPRELWNILEQMIELNEDKRIKPYDLYALSYFDDIRDIYPLEDNVEEINISTKVIYPFEESMIKTVVSWMGKVIHDIDHQFDYLMGYSAKTFLRLVTTHSIPLEQIQGYAIACILIGCSIFKVRFDLKDASYYCGQGTMYLVNDIKFFVGDTCKKLGWNLYPPFGMVDWNMPKHTTKQFFKWVRICCDPTFLVLPESDKKKEFDKIFYPGKKIKSTHTTEEIGSLFRFRK
jgi:serine/threonine protein kinase